MRNQDKTDYRIAYSGNWALEGTEPVYLKKIKEPPDDLYQIPANSARHEFRQETADKNGRVSS